MNRNMTPYVRRPLRALLARKGMSQRDLHKEIDVSAENISRALTGRSGKIPKLWQTMTEVVEGTVILVPNEKLEAIVKDLYGESVWLDIQADMLHEMARKKEKEEVVNDVSTNS